MIMDEFLKVLDENLQYIRHEIIGGTIYLYVISIQEELDCPYCGKPSLRVHSKYTRSFQDLPLQDKKVIIVINNKKMFCDNPKCEKTTFAETFEFLPPKGKKSKRLLDKITNISLTVSSITASSLLRDGIADVGKSTICNMLKKTKSQLYGKRK
jgi:transposase